MCFPDQIEINRDFPGTFFVLHLHEPHETASLLAEWSAFRTQHWTSSIPQDSLNREETLETYGAGGAPMVLVVFTEDNATGDKCKRNLCLAPFLLE